MEDWTDKKKDKQPSQDGNNCGTPECEGPFSEQQYQVFSFIVGMFTLAACFLHPFLLLIGLCEMVIIKMAHWYYYNRPRELFWAGAYMLLLGAMAFMKHIGAPPV